jgi:peptide/nickel transport system permease protein
MHDRRIQQAVLALASGNRVRARRLLRSLIIENPQHERAWLMMAEAVDDREQKIDCLERALIINPENRHVQVRLAEMLPSTKSRRSDLYDRQAAVTQSFKEDEYFPAARTQREWHTPPATEIHKPPDQVSQAKKRLGGLINWPLIIGGTLVALVLILAYFGPSLAMKDPLEMSTIHRVGEKYLIPPYPPGTPGYPLGSDSNGRDLLSRMLWGLRPTLTMVFIVAAVRLILGTIIGLTSGWSRGLTGRILDIAITTALSIPVIIVALGGIAAVGIDLGIWAFIFSLSITGWVETARVVREQTQSIGGQTYVEAARALGASDFSILSRHVLQQILSLLWMLFAFEISATLMLTAALGFLGYYIGGDIWVTVTDATATAVSGYPELGQMLATSDVSITKPWGLMGIGLLVFAIVLGFNLLGDGLRKQLSLYSKRGSTRWSRFMANLGYWFEEQIAYPVSELTRMPAFRPALALLLVGSILAGGLFWAYDHFTTSGNGSPVGISLQNVHLWSSARRDPFGTRWVQAAGPESPEVTWTFDDGTGFSGGPAVARDGTVYITSQGRLLYALTPQGQPIWQVLLAETPVGTPALNQNGDIYVSDAIGGLSAYRADGEFLWRYEPASNQSTMIGPIVSGSGTIYAVMQGKIAAFNPHGELLWNVDPASLYTAPSETVQVSPQEDLLLWGDVILDAKTGSTIEPANLARPDRYFIGADGNIYQVDGHEVIQWNRGSIEAGEANKITWDHSKFSIARTPTDAGAAPDGTVWLFYTSFARGFGFGEDTRIVWLNEEGELIGNAFHPIRNSQVIGIDKDHIIYVCGNLERGYGDPQCAVFTPSSKSAQWTLMLEGSHEVAGGALIPGRLYIASLEGILYAVGLPEVSSMPQQAADKANEQPSTAADYEKGEPTEAEESILNQAEEATGPTQGSAALIFEDTQGFSGGPAVDDDGTIYILSRSGAFYSLNPQGELNWSVSLPATPVGTPAIGDEGEIYLSDREGSLSAYTSTGEMIWRFMPEGEFKAISGPVIAPNGSLYYTLGPGGMIQAVSPNGEGLWQTKLKTSQIYRTPDVNSQGNLIFFRNEVFDAVTGNPLNFELDFDVNLFFSGEDGRNYLRAGNTVVAWTIDTPGINLAEERVLLDENMGEPFDAFVSPSGAIGLLYNSGVLWFAKDGKAIGSSFPKDSFLEHGIALDNDYMVYTCGRRPVNFLLDSKPICYALSPGENKPTWEAVLGDDLVDYSGSLLAPGILYVATEEGHLYAIGGEQ